MENGRSRGILRWAWLFYAVWLNAAGTGQPTGAGLLKTDLMGIFAHPDDETGVAGLMARYALGEGKVVAHVYCTRGEGGGNMVGTQWGPALGILREAELRDCLAHLGVRHCHFLERADFAYTEGLGITLEKWGHDETLERLVRLVRALRPEVMVTMNPAPTPGQHGNHQAAGWLAVEAFDAAADPMRFPDQLLHEGLHPWRPRKLYFGGAGPYGATIITTNLLADGRSPAQIAGEALANHRSQGFGNFGASPWLRRPQRLQLVKSVVPFATNELDLFAGLPVAGDVPARLLPAATPPPPMGPVRMRFLPRPAVSRYQEWVRVQKIEPAAVSFDPDLPVVAGEDSPVRLEILDHPGSAAGVVNFRAPGGWKVVPDRIEYGGPDRRSTYFRILQVHAPTSARGGVLEALATGSDGGVGPPIRVRLHPVPHLRIPRLALLPALGAGMDDPAWAALPPILIPHTNIWEGAVSNDLDSSAVFRCAHDGTWLGFEIRVTDDVVVSNIEPDDIKGHWRSDSVELCLDPAAGAEDTLGTFKVGIFPFDRSGNVRAARDADARQGLVEETAPGLRLVSLRTPDGYLIRGVMPLELAGINLTRSRRIGLNVLIYDGDKRDAAPGENINKSRLAWAPRPGVQGRPEDWGRADLE